MSATALTNKKINLNTKQKEKPSQVTLKTPLKKNGPQPLQIREMLGPHGSRENLKQGCSGEVNKASPG